MYDYRTVDHTEEHGIDFVAHRGVLDAQSGAPWVQTYMQLQAEV